MKVACYSLFSTIVQKYSNIFENNSKVLTFFPIAIICLLLSIF